MKKENLIKEMILFIIVCIIALPLDILFISKIEEPLRSFLSITITVLLFMLARSVISKISKKS